MCEIFPERSGFFKFSLFGFIHIELTKMDTEMNQIGLKWTAKCTGNVQIEDILGG